MADVSNNSIIDLIDDVTVIERTAKSGAKYTVMNMVISGRTYEHMVDRAYAELIQLLIETNNNK